MSLSWNAPFRFFISLFHKDCLNPFIIYSHNKKVEKWCSFGLSTSLSSFLFLLQFLRSLYSCFLSLTSYGKKPGLSKFQFAKDMSSRNYRKQDKCGIDIVLTWKKEVQSSCFSTPVAFPLFNNGQDDVFHIIESDCVDHC